MATFGAFQMTINKNLSIHTLDFLLERNSLIFKELFGLCGFPFFTSN